MEYGTWISTNDKLPELTSPRGDSSDDVLILLENGICDVACRMYEPDEKIGWWLSSDEKQLMRWSKLFIGSLFLNYLTV